MSLFKELRRRNVFKAAIAYIITGWLVLQVADVVLNNIAAPGWVFKTIMLLLAIGFPMVLVFAWAFELTPEGLKREHEVNRDHSIASETGRKLNSAIFTVMALALAYFVYDKFSAAPRQAAIEATASQQQAVTSSASSAQRSIAVLPFADMSPAGDQEYFTDGLSEELLNLLARIPELKVASRSSSFLFKDKGVDITEAARQLNVEHVLEGSVRKDGDQLRITAQLIKADDGYHVWSQTYDRKMESVFAIQDEIAAAVVAALKLTLLNEAPKARETNPEAYALYLQGRYLYSQNTPNAWDKAVPAFQKSLAIDPDYAPAWAAISKVYADQADFGEIDAVEGMALARSAVGRALALDPQSAEAWASLGYIRWGYDWNWAGAEQADTRALELEPGNAEVISQSARVKQTLGETDQAIALLQQAIALDPLSLRPLGNLGGSLRSAGRLDEAEEAYRRLINLNPGFANSNSSLSLVLMRQGRLDEALKFAQAESSDVWRSYSLMFVLYARGDQPAADTQMQAFSDHYASVAAYQMAEISAFRGDIEGAFSWLDRAYAQRDGGLTGLLYDEWFQPLHNDPRWRTLLKKTGLLDYWDAIQT